MQPNLNDSIPFLNDLTLVDRKDILKAFLTPVNLAGIASSVYNDLYSSTSSNDIIRFNHLSVLYKSVFEAKNESADNYGMFYSSTVENTTIEYKAIQEIMKDMSKQETEDFIQTYKMKSLNDDNGVVVQNSDYNIAQIASVIGHDKFKNIAVLPKHISSKIDFSSGYHPTSHKIKHKFIVSLLEDLSKDVLHDLKNYSVIKQKTLDEALVNQEKEVNDDVQFLRDKGHNVLKEDVRSYLEFNRLYRVAKNNQSITDSIDIAMNRNEALSIAKVINNPELLDYVTHVRLRHFNNEAIFSSIKSFYKNTDENLDIYMSKNSESHVIYQLASIIKKDKRRHDPEYRESILDESFFKPKVERRRLFGL